MRSELHLARRAASLAQQRLAAATSEAALRDHSAKALVAKQSCELETLRSERSWDEVTHRRSGSQLSAVSSHASSMEALSRVAVASLGSEIALLEARRQETTSQLADLLDAYKVQGEHLGMLHEQATRAHALLAQQQEQLVDMQKQLTAQQRRATRLQGEVHAARLIQTERGRMQEALEHAEMVRARAEQQAASHDAVERTLRAEAAQEREASIEALARQEAGHEAEMSAVRSGACGARSTDAPRPIRTHTHTHTHIVRSHPPLPLRRRCAGDWTSSRRSSRAFSPTRRA